MELSRVPKVGKRVGTTCGYCGFSRADDQPKQRAKVGKTWLDIGQEASQKLGRLQLAAKLYTLEVCPACGAVIDIIEKPSR